MNLNIAQGMAWDLMRQHGLTGEWAFKWDRARRRFGGCSFRTHTIQLSRHLVALNDEVKVKDVILHEIAHALAGPRQGHNHIWKAICRRIGAKPERCYKVTDTAVVSTPYIGTCPACGTTIDRMAIRGRVATTACKACCDKHNGGKHSPQFVFTWTKDGRPYTPPVRVIRTRRWRRRMLAPALQGPVFAQLFGLNDERDL